MPKQEQTTGNNSQSQQAGRDVINVGLSYTDVHHIVHDIMRGELAIANRNAQDEMARRLEFFADKLIPALVEKNIAAERFAKPEVQLFVHETQRRFLESGREEPSQMTIDLVTRTLGETPGSPRELIFKEAAKISSSINFHTANFVSVLFTLTRTKKIFSFEIKSQVCNFDLQANLKGLVQLFESDLKKLLPIPDLSPTERDYLIMVGILDRQSFKQFSPEDYVKNHTNDLPKPLTKAEVEELLRMGAKQEEFTWILPDKEHAYVVDGSQVDFSSFSLNALSPHAEKPNSWWRSDAKWQARIKETGGAIVEAALSRAAAESEVFSNLSQLHSKNIIGHEFLTPIGMAIGLSNLRRLGLSYDDKIWFPD